MMRTWDWIARARRPAFRAVAAVLVASAGASAQSNVCDNLQLELPVPEIQLLPETRRLVLTWNEIDVTEGRAATNVVLRGFDALSSGVTLVPPYLKDCDFRLNITKIPREGFTAKVSLVYRLQLNRSGIGVPFAIDTLDVFAPDSVHFFDPDLIGNLGISVTGNINQPGGPLGGVPVTVSGLNTGLSPTSNFVVSLVDSVAVDFPNAPMTVRVVGPYQTLPAPGGTLARNFLVTQAGVRVGIQNGMSLSFGPGTVSPGDSTFWSVRHLFPPSGRIEADLEAFEGYQVWRSDLPGVETDFTLIGEIRQCTSKFDFVLVNEDEFSQLDISLVYRPDLRIFELTDRDVHDDFPYRYAVSTFDRGFLGNAQNITCEGERAVTEKIYPALQSRNKFQPQAFVVPNPYKRRSAWEEGEPKVVFANLPPQCTIRIFTASTDHVATFRHGPNEPRSTSPTTTSWNLVSDGGQAIVPGIYIYYIESPEGDQQTGKLIVVR